MSTYVAMYDFKAEADDELSLEKGAKVNIISEINQDWYECQRKNSNLKGLVPKNILALDRNNSIRPTNVDVREVHKTEEQKTQLMELTMKGSDTNDSITTNNVSNEIDGNDIIKHGKKLGGETNEHVDALQRETKQPAAAVSISASSLFSLATSASFSL